MIVKIKTFVALLALLPWLLLACGQKTAPTENASPDPVTPIPANTVKLRTGAARVEAYLPFLKGKKVALVVNQTSLIGDTHLVDSLLALGVAVQKIFAPEHGFRGEADAGEQLDDGTDPLTGLPITSLYGSKKKPTAADLAGLNLVVFDIQDVGARFYTYISSLSYLMEACAENGLPLLVLDRPNPNGHYVDGPVMEPGFESFVGLHAGVPVVHGMTVGEYAQMVNGEHWLADSLQCDLTIVPCGGYDHATFYELPVRPSPNLPNMRSIYLYPSLCFFEGTNVSVGRGTDKQFQVLGMPGYPAGEFTFTPVPMPGAKHPKHEGRQCRGFDLSKMELKKLQQTKRLDIGWLLDFYANCPDQNDFFLQNNFFDKLAGGATLRQQIIAGKTEVEIRASWQPDLEKFKAKRKKYLLYPGTR